MSETFHNVYFWRKLKNKNKKKDHTRIIISVMHSKLDYLASQMRNHEA